jgi:hypothetical protein
MGSLRNLRRNYTNQKIQPYWIRDLFKYLCKQLDSACCSMSSSKTGEPCILVYWKYPQSSDPTIIKEACKTFIIDCGDPSLALRVKSHFLGPRFFGYFIVGEKI